MIVENSHLSKRLNKTGKIEADKQMAKSVEVMQPWPPQDSVVESLHFRAAEAPIVCERRQDVPSASRVRISSGLRETELDPTVRNEVKGEFFCDRDSNSIDGRVDRRTTNFRSTPFVSRLNCSYT
ncbi:hypothetical protein Nepgr_001730 [Nepenthes gracilis]|uniref:Uncharacterized protein n=1 Tax=Nepenthes gracilis TaxID=150966 RepID=A0AAD3P512_NEPGR|nr:hypothetical protein Nepgr_001730 [Nepenthes gracilis]